MRSPAGRGHAPGAPGLPAAHRPRGPRGQKGGGRVPEGRAWAAGTRRARGRASFLLLLLLPTRVRGAWPHSGVSQSRPRGKGLQQRRRRAAVARGGPLRPQPPALPHLPAAGDMFRPPTPPRAARGSHAPGKPRPRPQKATSPKSPRPRPDRMRSTDPSTASCGDPNTRHLTTAHCQNPHRYYHGTQSQPASNAKVLPAEILAVNQAAAKPQGLSAYAAGYTP